MKNHAKNKLTAAILFCVFSIQPVIADTVSSKSSLSNSFKKLEFDIHSKSPVKFYIKNTNNNLNVLGQYGEVYTNLNSVMYNRKPRFKSSSENTFSLSYFGAATDDYLGECVSFIKAVTNAKETAKWYGTKNVNKYEKLSPFTPIATFTKTRYDGKKGYNGRDGKSHVGLYLNHYKDGILVFDQNFYEDGKLNVHYIPFSGNNQNNAGNYYVLEQD